MILSVAVLVVSLFGLVHQDGVLRESADLVEHNIYHDEHGREIFRQWIVWDYFEGSGQHHVRWWILDKGRDRRTSIGFLRDHNGAILRVRAASRGYLIRTWTQSDPEIDDRRLMPQEKRRGLD